MRKNSKSKISNAKFIFVSDAEIVLDFFLTLQYKSTIIKYAFHFILPFSKSGRLM